jgi:voltage-gated sodium channel
MSPKDKEPKRSGSPLPAFANDEKLRRMIREEVGGTIRNELRHFVEHEFRKGLEDFFKERHSQMLAEMGNVDDMLDAAEEAELEAEAKEGEAVGPQFSSVTGVPRLEKSMTSESKDHTHHLIEHEYELVKKMLPNSWARRGRDMLNEYLHSHMIEPPRESRLAKVIDGPHFEGINVILITGNAALMFFMTNHVAEYGNGAMPVWMQVFEKVCLACFVVEFLCKARVHCWWYFFGSDFFWNWLDFILIIASIAESSSARGNFMFLRVMRILRTAKVLRVFRLMQFLSELRLILNSIFGWVSKLFWSLVMMALIFYVFSVAFVQQAALHMMDIDGSLYDTNWEPLRMTFGTVQQGMLSLYLASTGGKDWGTFYDILEPCGSLTCMLYLFFIAFTQIAVMNILTGIFVENAMKHAEPDKDSRYLDMLRQQTHEVKALFALCKEIDVDNSGTISMTEVTRMLHEEDSSFRKHFFEMGLRPLEIECFFEMMTAAGSGDAVELGHFVHGITKMRGQATSIDLQRLLYQVKVMHTQVDAIATIVKDYSEVPSKSSPKSKDAMKNTRDAREVISKNTMEFGV